VGLPSRQRFLSTNPKGIIYGTLTQGELNNYLEVLSAGVESRKQEIKASWPAAASTFQQLVATEVGLPESAVTRALPPETNEYLSQIKARVAFAKTFANYPISFEEIEIDKLVASQRSMSYRVRMNNGCCAGSAVRFPRPRPRSQ
jgi:hypothetical protein